MKQGFSPSEAVGDALPHVWLNGKIIRSVDAKVSIFDKGFQIGDGLFETLRILETCPLVWTQHWGRFAGSARVFGFKMPVTRMECANAIQQLLVANEVTHAIARIHLSRGIGPRGYSPSNANSPILAITLHPPVEINPGQPRQWRLITARSVFPGSASITQHKTSSRMFNVAAKLEADRLNVDDALILNSTGKVTEAISSNVFWISKDTVYTPSPALGILPGITRSTVLRLCEKLGVQTREVVATSTTVEKADAIFLSVSTSGIIEVVELDGKKVHRRPLVAELHAQMELHYRKAAERFQRTRATKP